MVNFIQSCVIGVGRFALVISAAAAFFLILFWPLLMIELTGNLNWAWGYVAHLTALFWALGD